LGSFVYNNTDRTTHDTPPGATIDISGEDKAYSGELQYLFRSNNINIVSGAGYFKIDSQDVITLDISLPFPPFLIHDVSINDFDVKHTNFYVYATLNYEKKLAFTVGGSADLFDGGNNNKDQFNPKIGIIWNPIPETTVRAAAFKVLKRTLITDQTLEPTQVAGFNQFFDEPNGTSSWLYGVAIDQKFSQNIYGGIEYSKRDQDVPFPSLSGNITRTNWDENLARAYLYWTPHKSIALRAEYIYEKFSRSDDFNLNLKDLEANRIPLGINFFHSSGLTAMLGATHYDQSGTFNRLTAPPGVFETGDDNFWLADAAVGYRLPQRYGIITIGAKNLFDKSFQYFDTDPFNPTIQPQRMFYARMTVSI
jgi:hypothetical protein